MTNQSQAEIDIRAERERQKAIEGWTSEHDDEHDKGELARAADAYCGVWDVGKVPREWPWESRWWKPNGRRRNLVKAGALYTAEIERLQRRIEEVSEEIKNIDGREAVP